MTQTLLILGGTGKTGRRLADRLEANDIAVRVASRQAIGKQTPFDWSRPETHAPALAGIGAVYLIPPPLVEDPTALIDPFLDAARSAGVGRIVLLSSLGLTFPGEPTESGRLKLEAQIESAGFDWVVLRPSGFAQNFSESFLLPGILRDNAFATTTEDGLAPLIDADDIAAVAAAVLTGDRHTGSRLALTGPQALSFDSAAAIISRAAGRQIAHRRIAPAQLQQILTSFGVPPAYSAMIVRDQEAIRDGRAAAVSEDVERVIGRPATPFAEFAEAAAGAWRQAGS